MSTNQYDDKDPYSLISDTEDEPAAKQVEHSSDGKTRTPSEHSSSSDLSEHLTEDTSEQQPSEQTTDYATINSSTKPAVEQTGSLEQTDAVEQTEQSPETEREQFTEQTTEYATINRSSKVVVVEEQTDQSPETEKEQFTEQTTEYATINRSSEVVVVVEQTEQSTEHVRVVRELSTERTSQEPTQEQPSDHSDSQVNGSLDLVKSWPSRVQVTGPGLAGCVLGQELTFNVYAKSAGPGELSAFCSGPTQLAYCELRDRGDGTYTLCAQPEEPGDHVLQVRYEGEPVPGSPFTFPVTAVQNSSDDVIVVNGSLSQTWPSRVLVTGSGLAGGAVLGQELTFNVDARNGGPGVLTAYCTGPNRLAYCELRDHGDGTFTLRARPEETGDHVLQVKYEGEAVQGSPFIFPVTSSSRPDASRVMVSGPGVENGILSTFQSNFAVDTKGAGAGNLSIRMQGPKGAFRMAMSRMTQGDRKVFCHYNPRSTGVYIIIVRWSNVDVPGSPFKVKIFDNPYEMEKDLYRQN